MLIMKDYAKFQVLAKKLLWKYLIFLIKSKYMKNLPNILTSLRLASPIYFIFVIGFFENQQIQSLIFFIYSFLSITDYFDGYLARKLNITSILERFLILYLIKY